VCLYLLSSHGILTLHIVPHSPEPGLLAQSPHRQVTEFKRLAWGNRHFMGFFFSHPENILGLFTGCFLPVSEWFIHLKTSEADQGWQYKGTHQLTIGSLRTMRAFI
jgi:hypothetical protein